MDQKEIAQLIQRYRSGLASPEDVQKLETLWAQAGDDHSVLENLPVPDQEALQGAMLRNIRLGIAAQRRQEIPFYRGAWRYKAAAVLIIMALASVWLYRSANSMEEIRTGFGERITVTLPDKSSVILNGNSVLRYAADWNETGSRRVWIEGEGFFSVTHTEDHRKFIVHALNDLNIEVLGTKFNVKSREFTSQVMLAEGKVKLDLDDRTEAAPVFLKPGELGTMNEKRISKRVVKQQQYTSWVDNKLVFDRTPLSDIAVLLTETYGFQVRLKEPELAVRELSGEISSATADDILYAIAETLNLAVEKEKQSVIISLKHE
jgi:ferric-dicitrate binding protein FerR (iron transport regulator)